METLAMMKTLSAIAVAALLGASAAYAETATTAPNAAPSPDKAPSATSASPSTLSLDDAQAKTWIDKVVYSSDDKNIGEVAQIARDPSGKVTELHIDIGGIMGIGETRVRVSPEQFSFASDRVVLSMTAEQTKTLPKIETN
jgi:hypothetical protein